MTVKTSAKIGVDIKDLELWTTAQTSNLRVLWICDTFLNKIGEILYFTSIVE